MSASNISVNPDVRIIHGRVTTILSFADRVVFVCSTCGHTKHIQYLVPPHLNVTIYDQSDYCVCAQQMSNRHMLEEVSAGMAKCHTLDEARLLVLSLKSAAS